MRKSRKNKKRKNRKYRYNGKKKIVLLLLILILAVILIQCSRGDSWRDDTKVVAYLPSWNYGCYEDIDFNELTDINIAFVNPDADGNLSVAIPDEVIEAIIKKAHKHDVKVLIALGGGNGTANYASLTSSSKSRKKFDEKIMDYVKKYDFDGIDVNIEGEVEPSFWNTYDEWVKDLRKKCDRNDLELTCACASWFDRNISTETLNMFDYVSIMAYDDKGAHNHSSYDYAENQLFYFSMDREVEEEKLLLGVPFYGYRYSGGMCTGEAVSYGKIVKDNKGAENADETGDVRYNGIETIKEKTDLASEYGGVMVWCLGQDSNSRYSLLGAINEALTEKE